jgi:hypothetical protein
MFFPLRFAADSTSRTARRHLARIAVALPLAGWAAGAAAMPANGGFETGDLTGWSASGDVSVTNAGFGVGPNSGTYQALITNRSTDQIADEGPEPETPFSGTNSVSPATLEALMGRAPGSLDLLSAAIGGTEATTQGSAMQVSFTANAGDTVSFAFNFLTAEADADANDFGFVSLSATGGDDVFDALSDVFTATPTLSPTTPLTGPSTADTEFDTETGFTLFSHTLAAGGVYTLTIGVVDVGDPAIGSALLIDDVEHTSAAVPAPGAIAVMAIGIGAMYWRRRRTA